MISQTVIYLILNYLIECGWLHDVTDWFIKQAIIYLTDWFNFIDCGPFY